MTSQHLRYNRGMTFRSRAASVVGALVLAGAAAAGCGSESPPASEPVVEDGGAGHIHGLGVDPADDTLIVATHSGMFRAAPGEREARRIGDRRQDTMGFTVVGPRRFLGSGHPDLRDDLPPLLGLIRSDDAGRSWTPVSLLGEVDFHVLRAAGSRVYGVDAQTGRLLASPDSGRSWETRRPPGPVIDLALDPADPERIVVTTEGGLHVSRDAGRGWRPLDAERAGLLSWGDELVLVDAEGRVHASRDGGRSWDERGSIGGQPAALARGGERELLAATHENVVKVSKDGGRSWQVRAGPM